MHKYQRIRDMREDNDMTQSAIATALGVSRQQYARWESGANEIPLHKLIILARLYNVSLDFLAGLIDEPRPLV